jgi:hypothetical protein
MTRYADTPERFHMRRSQLRMYPGWVLTHPLLESAWRPVDVEPAAWLSAPPPNVGRLPTAPVTYHR